MRGANEAAAGGAIYNNPELMFPGAAKLFKNMRNTAFGATASMDHGKPHEKRPSFRLRRSRSRSRDRRGSVQSELWMKNIISQPQFDKFRRQASLSSDNEDPGIFKCTLHLKINSFSWGSRNSYIRNFICFS